MYGILKNGLYAVGAIATAKGVCGWCCFAHKNEGFSNVSDVVVMCIHVTMRGIEVFYTC